MSTPPVDLNKRIEQYVVVRDRIKEIKKRHKEELAPWDDTLEKLNGVLLGHLNAIGVDSVAGEAGTAYKTMKQSASIADVKAFWDFIVANQAWDLIDKKANVPAVADYIEEHKAAPPGVNFNQVFVAGVRRG